MEKLVNALIDKNFWKGKKVLITGNTGFKGSWLSLWLNSIGAEVYGYSLPLDNSKLLYNLLKLESSVNQTFGDINDYDFLEKNIVNSKPDVIFHMAAQPLVRDSYINPIETISTNVIGTANILDICRKVNTTQVIVVITSDKCYENFEQDTAYKEENPMGGHDPYSASKGCAELITASYRKSFFNNNSSASVSSVRAGNVIGGGDWSKDRLIPDSIKAFNNNTPVNIRYPNSIRPWQDVLDPLFGYLILAENQWKENIKYAQAWNFGPDSDSERSVENIMNMICKKWGNQASWVKNNHDEPHEASILKLDSSKSKNYLSWKPQKNIKETINDLVTWYLSWNDQANMQDISMKYIEKYDI